MKPKSDIQIELEDQIREIIESYFGEDTVHPELVTEILALLKQQTLKVCEGLKVKQSKSYSNEPIDVDIAFEAGYNQALKDVEQNI